MQSVKRNKLRISTVIRAVTFLFFVVAAYGPWVLAFVLDKSLDAIDWKTWTLLAVIAGAANAVSALWRRDDDSPRTMALWGLILKLCLLPLYAPTLIFLAILTMCLAAPGYLILFLAYVGQPIANLMILIPLSSSYGLVAAHLGCKQRLISESSAHYYIALHLLPAIDLLSSICLYVKLWKEQRARAASTEQASQDYNVSSHKHTAPPGLFKRFRDEAEAEPRA
jgi:membrane protein